MVYSSPLVDKLTHTQLFTKMVKLLYFVSIFNPSSQTISFGFTYSYKFYVSIPSKIFEIFFSFNVETFSPRFEAIEWKDSFKAQ